MKKYQCITCKEHKELSEFPESIRLSKCTSCQRKYAREWRKANPEKVLATGRKASKKFYKRHPEKVIARKQKWEAGHPRQAAFTAQRRRAIKRGIEWRLDLEEFRELWTIDLFLKRGPRSGQLVMGRFNDEAIKEGMEVEISWFLNKKGFKSVSTIREKPKYVK